jgi:putative ABC transport system ATP-binding protein
MVLQNVNISIGEGEFVSLLGPSGSGKTTLLSVLGLVDVPTGGEVSFNGQETAQLSEKKRNALRRGRVAFVFENYNLIEELTVFENIELPLLYLPYTASERRRMVEAVLEQFRLTHRKRTYPVSIGGTLQQKVALARASVFQPMVIFADEPTGNLDSSGGGEIMDLFSMMNEQGQTIVMATHSASLARRGQRVIQLFDGHVVSTPQKNLL